MVKSDAAKRTGNPYDETILKNISLEIFDLTNSIRARNGVALLEWCDIAAGTAKAHSQDMQIRIILTIQTLKDLIHSSV